MYHIWVSNSENNGTLTRLDRAYKTRSAAHYHRAHLLIKDYRHDDTVIMRVMRCMKDTGWYCDVCAKHHDAPADAPEGEG